MCRSPLLAYRTSRSTAAESRAVTGWREPGPRHDVRPQTMPSKPGSHTRPGRRGAEQLRRRLQVLGRDVADVLGKVPVVPLDIRRSVGPVAVELVLGLGEDGGTGALGALEVLVHVVNVDVHVLCHVAEALRVLKLGAGVPHHHDTVCQLHLSVHDLSTWPGHPHALSEAEGLDQPVQRVGHVFVVQVRGDAGHVLRRVCGHRAFPPCAALGFILTSAASTTTPVRGRVISPAGSRCGPTQPRRRGCLSLPAGSRGRTPGGKRRYSTMSFLRLWTNATTSRCSASATWNFARVAAA